MKNNKQKDNFVSQSINTTKRDCLANSNNNFVSKSSRGVYSSDIRVNLNTKSNRRIY